MGLDTSHDAWHGSYSGFSSFREQIAKTLNLVDEDGRYYPTLFSEVDDSTYPLRQEVEQITDYQGNWDEPAPDPILYLLAHSDCDGIIRNEHLGPLIKRLEDVLAVEQEPDPLQEREQERFLERVQRFIDGAQDALDAGEDIDFH